MNNFRCLLGMLRKHNYSDDFVNLDMVDSYVSSHYANSSVEGATAQHSILLEKIKFYLSISENARKETKRLEQLRNVCKDLFEDFVTSETAKSMATDKTTVLVSNLVIDKIVELVHAQAGSAICRINNSYTSSNNNNSNSSGNGSTSGSISSSSRSGSISAPANFLPIWQNTLQEVELDSGREMFRMFLRRLSNDGQSLSAVQYLNRYMGLLERQVQADSFSASTAKCVVERYKNFNII